MTTKIIRVIGEFLDLEEWEGRGNQYDQVFSGTDLAVLKIQFNLYKMNNWIIGVKEREIGVGWRGIHTAASHIVHCDINDGGSSAVDGGIDVQIG